MGVTGIPILPSRDLSATVEAYAPLGFAEAGLWPGHLILVHPSGVEVHFWHHPDEDPPANVSSCYFRFDSAAEVEALHAQWAATGLPAQGMPRLGPLAATDYGLLETHMVDADGNLVRLGGVIPVDG